jgi:hypothetical protein
MYSFIYAYDMMSVSGFEYKFAPRRDTDEGHSGIGRTKQLLFWSLNKIIIFRITIPVQESPSLKAALRWRCFIAFPIYSAYLSISNRISRKDSNFHTLNFPMEKKEICVMFCMVSYFNKIGI